MGGCEGGCVERRDTGHHVARMFRMFEMFGMFGMFRTRRTFRTSRKPRPAGPFRSSQKSLIGGGSPPPLDVRDVPDIPDVPKVEGGGLLFS